MNLKHSYLLLLVGIAFACESPKHQHREHADHQPADHGLELNNGQRWAANPETTTGVQNMRQLLENFDAASDLTSYQELKVELEAEFQQIFQKCTMKGEAHDQLHNFLLPLKAMFEKLASEDSATREATAEALETHLMVYAEYFD